MTENERQVTAEKFLSQIDGLSSKREIHVTGLNLENSTDLTLALTSLLRGKNEEDYHQIVTGLYDKFHKAEGNTAEQNRLRTLASTVMNIGENVLGIEWN